MIPVSEDVEPLLPPGESVVRIEPLCGDGSSRTFYRVAGRRTTFVLCVGPDPAENGAYVRVGRHLAARGVRVPAVHGWNEGRGYVLVEDLGDRSLLSAVRATTGEEGLLALYEPVLDLLVRMQVEGSRGFELKLGFAPAPYGPELMVEQEGLYFAREFAEGLLGLAAPAALRQELERLAKKASRAPAHHFLHRDFQSRNVHLTDSGPAAIDFQGARPGPLAYDAAALILDPYVGHSPSVRSRLLGSYLARLRDEGLDGEVERSWTPLGAFRLLQALGAFAKLGGRLKKPGFLEHAATALDTILEHLAEEGRRSYPSLHELVVEAREAWRERQRLG